MFIMLQKEKISNEIDLVRLCDCSLFRYTSIVNSVVVHPGRQRRS